MTNKRCTKCNEEKSMENFYQHKKTYKIDSWCRNCKKIDVQIRQSKKDYRPNYLYKKYSITIEDFNNMLKSQNYSCEICEKDSPGNYGTWNVDHCHLSGKIRGLLCVKCNNILELSKENIFLLQKCIEYLKEYS